MASETVDRVPVTVTFRCQFCGRLVKELFACSRCGREGCGTCLPQDELRGCPVCLPGSCQGTCESYCQNKCEMDPQ